ncbi:MAG: hypothetical protein UR53_C0003G0010 [Candidatus Magasanikbacteria bacterium GW2011_GWC2_34_16]|uniref:Uncharacterized protein n=2 Tax=Candidatus Magasanikiibacteriota TaxID=1752731 RepID=A0A0G0KL25_9BACT|nr:MAG: hypothetical protein UR53_C0003G0010 [Candidatus Magasanikbacteria bacterium GW2011_GWC2_34_16]KKQ41286.1 MAG: hypothetical protein US58_C0002G0009 [Candidatus Magasanikbacteria bacterium GW2011_GWA2_37_8]
MLTVRAFLNQFARFILPTKKLGWISFVFIFVLGTVAYLASAGGAAAFWEGIANAIAQYILLPLAVLALKLSLFCLTFIIELAGYNGYLDSTAVNVGWVMVRDITNMFFVVILLLIAFGTILGIEQYEWKKMLVKFVMAAILVNFSRIICGVIIDVGQVVMITFVNGIAATAGGNLINAFSADKLLQLTGQTINDAEMFLASVAALTFAAMMLAVMLVFVFMLLARMIVLWVLIVLSPLAFVLSVIPQTQKFASNWWSEFGNHVIVGPVVVFFIWLSFVTVGAGNISTEIGNHSQIDPSLKIKEDSVLEADQIGGQSAGISSVMSWAKMANFAIAIGMLLVGAKVAQQLGVMGGGAMSKAVDFGKKVGMIASGVSAARFLGAGALKGAKTGLKWTAMNVPGVGGKAWVRRGKTIAAGAGLAWGAADERRDKMAEELESRAATKIREAKGKGWLANINAGAQAFVMRRASGVIESEARGEKKVEKLEKARKMQKEDIIGSTSTSRSWEGGIGTRMADRAARVKERSAAKEARNKARGQRIFSVVEDRYEQAQVALKDLEKEKAGLAAEREQALADGQSTASIDLKISENDGKIQTQTKESEDAYKSLKKLAGAQAGGGPFGWNIYGSRGTMGKGIAASQNEAQLNKLVADRITSEMTTRDLKSTKPLALIPPYAKGGLDLAGLTPLDKDGNPVELESMSLADRTALLGMQAEAEKNNVDTANSSAKYRMLARNPGGIAGEYVDTLVEKHDWENANVQERNRQMGEAEVRHVSHTKAHLVNRDPVKDKELIETEEKIQGMESAQESSDKNEEKIKRIQQLRSSAVEKSLQVGVIEQKIAQHQSAGHLPDSYKDLTDEKEALSSQLQEESRAADELQKQVDAKPSVSTGDSEKQVALLEKIAEAVANPGANGKFDVNGLKAQLSTAGLEDTFKQVYGKAGVADADQTFLERQELKTLRQMASLLRAKGKGQDWSAALRDPRKKRAELVEQKIVKEAGKDGTLAQSYTKVKSDQAALLKTKSVELLNEDVLQDVIASPRGSKLPADAGSTAVAQMQKNFSRMEKEELMRGLGNIFDKIMSAKRQARAGDKENGIKNYERSAEGQYDGLWQKGLMAELQRQRYLDDNMGTSERLTSENIDEQAKVVAAELHIDPTDQAAMEDFMNQFRAEARNTLNSRPRGGGRSESDIVQNWRSNMEGPAVQKVINDLKIDVDNPPSGPAALDQLKRDLKSYFDSNLNTGLSKSEVEHILAQLANNPGLKQSLKDLR